MINKGVSKTIKNEVKEQQGRILSMLLGTLGVSLLGNLLAGKEAIAIRQGRERSETFAMQVNMPGRGTIRAGEDTIRAGQDF